MYKGRVLKERMKVGSEMEIETLSCSSSSSWFWGSWIGLPGRDVGACRVVNKSNIFSLTTSVPSRPGQARISRERCVVKTRRTGSCRSLSTFYVPHDSDLFLIPVRPEAKPHHTYIAGPGFCCMLQAHHDQKLLTQVCQCVQGGVPLQFTQNCFFL